MQTSGVEKSDKYIIIDTSACKDEFCECKFICGCESQVRIHTCDYSRRLWIHHLHYYLNYWSEKGYIIDSNQMRSNETMIVIMVKKETTYDQQLCEEIKLLREAISYLPGIGSKFIEAENSFNDAAQTQT